MSDGNLTPSGFADDIAAAEAKGFIVVKGDDDTLLLDFDSEEGYAKFADTLLRFHGRLGFEYFGDIDTWHSKSGAGHRHVVIHLTQPMGVAERIATQTALGSDPVRSLLGLARLRNGVVEPNLLFKPAQLVQEVIPALTVTDDVVF